MIVQLSHIIFFLVINAKPNFLGYDIDLISQMLYAQHEVNLIQLCITINSDVM
jgi:hypothetical protein